jgi:hypothetical protein
MTVRGGKQYSGLAALQNARRLSAEARLPADAIRQVLGIDKRDRAAVPKPSITLPKLKFMEKPMPDWVEPPRPRRKGR